MADCSVSRTVGSNHSDVARCHQGLSFIYSIWRQNREALPSKGGIVNKNDKKRQTQGGFEAFQPQSLVLPGEKGVCRAYPSYSGGMFL